MSKSDKTITESDMFDHIPKQNIPDPFEGIDPSFLNLYGS